MPRSSLPFDDPGHRRRWGASVVVSLVIHAAAIAALAGVVYEASTPDEHQPQTIADVVMSLRGSSVEQFTRVPTASVTPLSNVLPPDTGASAAAADAPTLADVLTQVDKQAGASALGTVTSTSGTALDAVALGATGPAGGGGPAGSGAGGMSVVFAGLQASGEQARSVVYCVDVSGPMVSTLPEVFGELMRSVDELSATQKFGVVLFRDNGKTSAQQFAPELRDATASNRTALRAWLDGIDASGRSNPVDGLRAGLAMKPQALFLLSRSIKRGPGNPWLDEGAVMRELEVLNPADRSGKRPTIIKTLQFLEPDETGVMEKIGKFHGGVDPKSPPYRVLRRQELQRK